MNKFWQKSTPLYLSFPKLIIVITFLIIALLSIFLLTGCNKNVNSTSQKAIDFADNEVLISSSTDMHGRTWEEDILSGKETRNNYLALASLYDSLDTNLVKRAYLHDNGDIFQGTDMSTYNLKRSVFNQYHNVSPSAIALQAMRYDSFTPGNHEYNYDWDIMNNTYNYLKAVGVDAIACNVYYKDTNQRVFAPYNVKTLKADNMEIKVGVIGVCNTDTPKWDSEAGYPGMRFSSAENPNADISYEIKKAQEQMVADGNNCDITVVAVHSGFLPEGEKYEEGKDYFADFEKQAQEPLVYLQNTENQTYRAIRNSTGIDIFITGHDHVNYFSNLTVKNAEGKDVLIQSAGGTDATFAKYALSKDDSGKVNATFTGSANVAIENYEANEILKTAIGTFANDSIEYFSKKTENFLATLKGGWDNNQDLTLTDTYFRQTDVEDYIGRAAIWASKKYMNQVYTIDSLNKKIHEKYGDNVNYTPQNNEICADLSLASSTLSIENPKDGDLYKVDVYKIYKYDNTCCVHMLSGKQIKDILEYNASQRLYLTKDENGNTKVDIKGDKFTYVLAYGLNFNYDLEKSEGNRVEIFSFSNGKAFDENAYYMACISSYITGNPSNPTLQMCDDNNNLAPYASETKEKAQYINLMCEYAADVQDNYGAFYNTDNCDKNNETASHWKIINIE